MSVVKKVDFGVYLAEGDKAEEKVLLPKKEVPEEQNFTTRWMSSYIKIPVTV